MTSKSSSLRFRILLLLFLVLMPLTTACQNPLDNYAIEAVFNKQDISYNLGKINIANSNFEQGSYILQSTANKNLALIFSENSDLCENCLSMRLQIPIELTTSSVPYVDLTSSLTCKKVSLASDLQYYNGWTITNEEPNLELKKDSISMQANYASGSYEFLIEISEQLPDCTSCTGKCLYSRYGDLCIDNDKLADIEDVLKFLGLADNADSLFYSYKVIGKGDRTTTDLIPLQNYNAINLKDAFSQDLEWAKKSKIISISDTDIVNIINLADKGTAGNQRIIYSQQESKWIYYYELENAIITKEATCKEFPLSKIPQTKQAPITGNAISTFYLVPIGIFVFLLVLFAILVLVARTVAHHKSSKLLKKEK